MHFITFCRVCILSYLHFVTFAICRFCILSCLHFGIFLYFVLFVFWCCILFCLCYGIFAFCHGFNGPHTLDTEIRKRVSKEVDIQYSLVQGISTSLKCPSPTNIDVFHFPCVFCFYYGLKISLQTLIDTRSIFAEFVSLNCKKIWLNLIESLHLKRKLVKTSRHENIWKFCNFQNLQGYVWARIVVVCTVTYLTFRAIIDFWKTILYQFLASCIMYSQNLFLTILKFSKKSADRQTDKRTKQDVGDPYPNEITKALPIINYCIAWVTFAGEYGDGFYTGPYITYEAYSIISILTNPKLKSKVQV